MDEGEEKVNEKESKVDANEEGKEPEEDKEAEDIDMKDQEENEDGKESDGESQDDKKQLDEDGEMKEEEEDEDKSSANVDDKNQMPISEKDLKEKREEQTKNSRADQSNANCDEKDVDEEKEEEKSKDADMNSVQDKISDTSEGQLGDQKSQYLDKIEEKSRKKMGSRDEERVVSEEKDKLVENFNLIEIEERIGEDSVEPEDAKDESAMESQSVNNELRHIRNKREAFDHQVC
jgi:hypothetical protein